LGHLGGKGRAYGGKGKTLRALIESFCQDRGSLISLWTIAKHRACLEVSFTCYLLSGPPRKVVGAKGNSLAPASLLKGNGSRTAAKRRSTWARSFLRGRRRGKKEVLFSKFPSCLTLRGELVSGLANQVKGTRISGRWFLGGSTSLIDIQRHGEPK